MFRYILFLLFFSGCIEYAPISNLPPAAVQNPRPLEPTENTDRLVQIDKPQVDILWVIDNSCSMLEEQEGLAYNFPVFMNYFLNSGLDYHIGVVSTDMVDVNQSGKLVGAQGFLYIDEETPNPSSVFSQMAVMGTGGSADERGLDSSYMALKVLKNGYNAGFLRDDASLHIVVISDEDDHSYQISASEYANWLLGMKSPEEEVTFSSIVSPNPVCPGAWESGTTYINVTQNVGGIEWSICNDDWSTILEQLGIQALGPRREYFLSKLPIPGTIDVSVVYNEITFNFVEGDDWVYEQKRNSVIFNEFVPQYLSEIYITYELLSEAEL